MNSCLLFSILFILWKFEMTCFHTTRDLIFIIFYLVFNIITNGCFILSLQTSAYIMLSFLVFPFIFLFSTWSSMSIFSTNQGVQFTPWIKMKNLTRSHESWVMNGKNRKDYKKISEIYTLYMLVMQCHYIGLVLKTLPQRFWTPLLSHLPTWDCFWECWRFVLCTCTHI